LRRLTPLCASTLSPPPLYERYFSPSSLCACWQTFLPGCLSLSSAPLIALRCALHLPAYARAGHGAAHAKAAGVTRRYLPT
jgi:hypothetical protein